MFEYTVEYTNGLSSLLVKPIKKRNFQIIEACINGSTMNAEELREMIHQAIALQHPVPEISIAAPKTPIRRSLVIPYSPVSVTTNTGSLEIDLYESHVIDSLRDILFQHSKKCDIPKSISCVEEYDPILLSIEGNIGAGKSTLLRALRQSHPEWIFVDEPLDTWTSLKNDAGQNLLELFYGDQDRWAYTFQNCCVLSRYQLIEGTIARHSGGKKSKRQVYITERCLETDYHVFAKMMRNDKKLDAIEFSLYEQWYRQLKGRSTSLGGVVYVDTCPATCVDRIKGRNRDGEDGIPLCYLENLHSFQEKWLGGVGVPVVRTCSVQGVEQLVDRILAHTA